MNTALLVSLLSLVTITAAAIGVGAITLMVIDVTARFRTPSGEGPGADLGDDAQDRSGYRARPGASRKEHRAA